MWKPSDHVPADVIVNLMQNGITARKVAPAGTCVLVYPHPDLALEAFEILSTAVFLGDASLSHCGCEVTITQGVDKIKPEKK